MPVSSNMSPETLDTLYIQALTKESFVKHCENLIDDAMNDDRDDSFFDECDAHHAVYGDTWTDEDEAALEQWEIDKRERLAIRNEY